MMHSRDVWRVRRRVVLCLLGAFFIPAGLSAQESRGLKIYLQHYRHGVKFLGAVVKPGRIHIANRTKGNLAAAIEHHNRVAEDHRPTQEEREAFRSSINSYLGIMRHYATWRLRRSILERVNRWWRRWFRVENGCTKVVVRARPIQSPGI